MITHIISNIRIRHLVLCLTVLWFSCGDDPKANGIITLESEEVILGADRDETVVKVSSTTEWRLEFDNQNWFDTDIRGSKPRRDYFTIMHEANGQDAIRSAQIRVFTSDGNSSETIRVIQMPRSPVISPSTDRVGLSAAAGSYTVDILTNVPEVEIALSVEYDQQDEAWITDHMLNDAVLSFDVSENTGDTERAAEIILSYTDIYGRIAGCAIEIRQAFVGNASNAEFKEISYVKTLPAGLITENIYISGNIGSTGSSDNYKANRYTLQDSNGNAVAFESGSTLLFNRYDKVELWLNEAVVSEYSEGTFDYKVITGIDASKIISQTADPAFTPKNLPISGITDEHLFAVVTIPDSEIASPHGAFTNFKLSAPITPVPDYMAEYPGYYLFYPTCIRDVEGSSMYLLTSPSASFAHTTLPQGGGSITGMVVREKLTNFDISENQFSIRPLELEDIAIDPDRNNGITSVLVEWTCTRPAGANTVTPITHIPPDIGPEEAVLIRSGSTGFWSNRPDNGIGFVDDFRGDNNMHLTNGAQGRSAGGTYNVNFNSGDYWYIDQLSTSGITTQLSLQVETNSWWGVGMDEMFIDFAYSLDDANWTILENGSFKCLSQFDRSAAGGKTENHIPGFKVYDFKLPGELNDKPNITIRLRPAIGSSTGGTHRLANVSIKYNKQ